MILSLDSPLSQNPKTSLESHISARGPPSRTLRTFPQTSPKTRYHPVSLALSWARSGPFHFPHTVTLREVTQREKTRKKNSHKEEYHREGTQRKRIRCQIGQHPVLRGSSPRWTLELAISLSPAIPNRDLKQTTSTFHREESDLPH